MLSALALDTAWTEGLRRGERPAASALVEHLQEVHRQHPGFTEGCAARCRDEDGLTSYDWLAGLADPARHGHILDLCCGSGPLLARLHERLPESTRLTGVDISTAELGLAKKRLPEGRAVLVEGLAQELDFLEDDSVDAVLCHWALTLVDPVETVLREVRRVLRPGGIFAAVVDGAADSAPGYAKVDALIFDFVRRALPGYGEVDLGDSRVRTEAELLALVRDIFPQADISVEGRCVHATGAPADLASEVAGFFYAAFVLSLEDRRLMLEGLAAHLGGATEGAEASFAMPVNLLRIALPS